MALIEGKKNPVVAGDNDFSRMIEGYLEEEVMGKSSLTYKAVRNDLRKFCCFFESQFGVENFREWNSRDTKAFLTSLSDEGFAPATVNRTLASLKSFGGWLLKKEVLHLNPTRGVKGFRIDEFKPQWIDDKSYNRMLRVADGLVRQGTANSFRNRTIFITLDSSALRVNEICNLKLSSLQGKWLKNVVCKGGQVRSILLRSDVIEGLQDYLTGYRVEGSDYLFTSHRGHKLHRSNIDDALKNIANIANLGLPFEEKIHFSCHKMRHRAAYKARQKSLLLAQRRLGHTSMRHLSRYGGLSVEEEEELIEG